MHSVECFLCLPLVLLVLLYRLLVFYVDDLAWWTIILMRAILENKVYVSLIYLMSLNYLFVSLFIFVDLLTD